MLQKIVRFHLVPLGIAIGIVSIIFMVIPTSVPTQKNISYTHKELVPNGKFSNFNDGIETELALVSSLHASEQITLFGSSEFSGTSIFFPYLFLKDSLQLNCLAFGEAHHQNFSILCELLAGRAFLEDSKITIIISPSWFEAKSTNAEAFLKFVKPNFLRKIINDSLINQKYKNHIGKFIYTNSAYFEGMTKEFSYLMDTYLANEGNLINKNIAKANLGIQAKHASNYYIPDVTYIPATPNTPVRKDWNTNLDSLLQAVQTKFLASISNDLYVKQDYYDTYLVEKNGSQKIGKIAEVDFLATDEMKDFELLLALLDENNVNASFVLLPLNPYFYANIEILKPLDEHLTKKIKTYNFPLLNLSCYDKQLYQKGILRDVMHVGDYGWILINDFMTKTYTTKND